MSVRTGYVYVCDRPDCSQHISLVPKPGEEVSDLLAKADWSWSKSGKLRHFCPKHGPNTKAAPRDGLSAALPNKERKPRQQTAKGRPTSCPSLTIA